MAVTRSVNYKVARIYVRAAEASPSVWDALKLIHEDEKQNYANLESLRSRLQETMERRALRFQKNIDKLNPSQIDLRVGMLKAAYDISRRSVDLRPSMEPAPKLRTEKKAKPAKPPGPRLYENEDRPAQDRVYEEPKPAPVTTQIVPIETSDAKLTPEQIEVLRQLFREYDNESTQLDIIVEWLKARRRVISDFAERHALWEVEGVRGMPTYGRHFKISAANGGYHGAIQFYDYSQAENSALSVTDKLEEARVPKSLYIAAPKLSDFLDMVRAGEQNAVRVYSTLTDGRLLGFSLTTRIELFASDGTLIRGGRREQKTEDTSSSP